MATGTASWTCSVPPRHRRSVIVRSSLVIALTGGVAGLTIALGVPLVALWSTLPKINGSISTPCLEHALEIIRDQHGIPHIFAASERDAWFGLGFVHAQDRFTNMELTRRIGRGRLAEAFGPPALASDRSFHTLGYARVAEAVTASLNAETRRLLEGYADGVNAALDAGNLPPELRALGIKPDPWVPADSILAIKMMGVLLAGNAQQEADRARLLDDLDEPRLRELWTTASSPLPGSNAWAVAGHLSASGKPLLASDPHLRFSAPSIWYLAHLHAPDLDVWGATIAGIAAVPIGRNAHVAWGMTAVYADTQDLYIETLGSEDASTYLTPEGVEPFATRVETIVVKGREPVQLTVKATRNGPVVSDLPNYAITRPGQAVAFRSYELADSDRSQRAAFRSVRATSAEAFSDAMHDLQSVSQTVVYADSRGDIGYLVTGRVPVRASGDGFLPVDALDPGASWSGFLAGAALPAAHNPPGGYVASANQYLAPADYPHFIMRDRPESYRADRLEELLAATPANGFTPAQFADFQTDVISRAARAVLPLLLSAGPFPEPDAEIPRILGGWDFRMEPSRPEPLLYSAWHRSVMQRLTPAVFHDRGVPIEPRPQLLVALLSQEIPGCGPGGLDCLQLVRDALQDAASWLRQHHGPDLATMRWDRAAPGRHSHRILEQVPLGGRLASIVRPHRGGPHTLLRMYSDWSDESQPFAGIHGAGVRLVHDLDTASRSLAVLSTGQAGHPLSPWYRDQAEYWFRGELIPFETDRGKIQRTAVLELTAGMQH